MKIKYIIIILLFLQQSFVTLSVQEITFSTINKNTTTYTLTNNTQEIERVPLNVVHQIYAQVIISNQSNEHLNNLFQSWKTINDRITRNNDNQIFRNFAQLYFEYLKSSSVTSCKNFVAAGILDDSSCLKLIKFLKANIKSVKRCIIDYSDFKSLKECADEFQLVAARNFEYVLNTYKHLDQYVIKKKDDYQ